MPAGEEVTVPVPVPAFVTVSVWLVVAAVISIQLTLKLAPVIEMRMNCCPAERLTPVLETSVQVCQPPVEGTVRLPVLSTPPKRTLTVEVPAGCRATRSFRS